MRKFSDLKITSEEDQARRTRDAQISTASEKFKETNPKVTKSKP